MCCLGLVMAACSAAPTGTSVASARGAETAGRAAARDAGGTVRTERVGALSPPPDAGSDVTGPGGLGPCEQRLEHSARPVLAVVGASFTAGTGPGDPLLSWAVRLARILNWNAVIDGVPGTGYVRPGAGGRGPALAMLARENLAAIHPALVIVQIGHDDIGVPVAVERRAVRTTLDYIHARAPRARIALITVFTSGRHSSAATAADRTIVSAARSADPDVIIGNPLTQHWYFPREVIGGLHPSAAGDDQIATIMAGLLRDHGVRPASGSAYGDAGAPVVCDEGVPARHQAGDQAGDQSALPPDSTTQARSPGT
jgi:lysophospholipase L1-like esterase